MRSIYYIIIHCIKKSLFFLFIIFLILPVDQLSSENILDRYETFFKWQDNLNLLAYRLSPLEIVAIDAYPDSSRIFVNMGSISSTKLSDDTRFLITKALSKRFRIRFIYHRIDDLEVHEEDLWVSMEMRATEKLWLFTAGNPKYDKKTIDSGWGFIYGTSPLKRISTSLILVDSYFNRKNKEGLRYTNAPVSFRTEFHYEAHSRLIFRGKITLETSSRKESRITTWHYRKKPNGILYILGYWDGEKVLTGTSVKVSNFRAFEHIHEPETFLSFNQVRTKIESFYLRKFHSWSLSGELYGLLECKTFRNRSNPAENHDYYRVEISPLIRTRCYFRRWILESLLTVDLYHHRRENVLLRTEIEDRDAPCKAGVAVIFPFTGGDIAFRVTQNIGRNIFGGGNIHFMLYF